MGPERIEAVGDRGEACIILVREVDRPNGDRELTYSLASGERLRRADGEDQFETLDGKRRFRVRG